MERFNRWAPWIVLTLGIVYVLRSMTPPPETPAAWRNKWYGHIYLAFNKVDPPTAQDQMMLSKFGGLPVWDKGRVKPIDSFARHHLLPLNRRQDYRDAEGHSQFAVRWFLDLQAEGMLSLISTIHVNDPDVIKKLGIRPRPDGRVHAEAIIEAAKRLDNKEQPPANIVAVVKEALGRQKVVEKMRNGLGKKDDCREQPVFRIDHDQVLAMLKLKGREGFRYAVSEISSNEMAFNDFIRKAMAAEKRDENSLDTTDQRSVELLGQLRMHMALSNLQGVTMVPDKEFSPDGWKTLGDTIRDGDERANPNAEKLMEIILAYAEGNVKKFNDGVDAYAKAVAVGVPKVASTARLEAWFNHFAPFYRCAGLYVITFILAVLSWVVWSKPLLRSAALLLVLTLTVHSAGLLLRMYIQGRPPVVNLYSSAVFIGWGCVLTCVIMENIFRNGVPTAVASMLGFMTMVIAHHLGGSGDTMEVLQAVLDTNFWLSTHVTTVTLGYTATFVAGFIAMVYLYRMLTSTVLAFFRNREDPKWQNTGVFIAAVGGLVFITTGIVNSTILGGYYVWTDDNPFGHPAGINPICLLLVVPPTLAIIIYAITIVLRYLAAEPGDLIRWMEPLNLNVNSAKAFQHAIYGVVCFALLLSFVGTVLGGIWADQSWGRFWGWDPKENGAILVVIINALILHARWGGMIRERGLVALAFVGNMVTMWSWFGTNQLGIGLHAYGFNKALVVMCTTFWITQMVLIGLALLPAQYWKSYTAVPEAAKPRKGAEAKARPDKTNIVAAS